MALRLFQQILPSAQEGLRRRQQQHRTLSLHHRPQEQAIVHLVDQVVDVT